MQCQQKYCKHNDENICQFKEISISSDGRCENIQYDAAKSKECRKCIYRIENYPTGRTNYIKYSCSKGHKLNDHKDNECWMIRIYDNSTWGNFRNGDDNLECKGC